MMEPQSRSLRDTLYLEARRYSNSQFVTIYLGVGRNLSGASDGEYDSGVPPRFQQQGFEGRKPRRGTSAEERVSSSSEKDGKSIRSGSAGENPILNSLFLTYYLCTTIFLLI